MSWLILLAGLALLAGSHLYKRLKPAEHEALGEKVKMYVTGAALLAIVLMIIGYQWAPYIEVWSPPHFVRHVNNLLMLLAFYIFYAGMAGVALSGKIRHPMLTGTKTWAVAHLLVNGDLASIILFGGLLAWAVMEVIFINKAEPNWERPAPKALKFEAIYAAGILVVFIAVGLVHGWLGYPPFG